MLRSRGLFAGCLFAVAMLLALPGAVMAQIPTLTRAGQQDRHVSITFSAPSASDVFVTVASSPEQGSDGAFFSENVVDSADLTADEIASGSWLSDDQLSPGRYWVVINGDPDLTCFLDDGTIDPACSDGYSNMLSVTIPQPSIRYRGAVSEMLADIGRLDLKLTVAPLGVKQAVRLCYSVTKHKHAAKRCVNQHLVGYDWNKPASAILALSTRGMSKRELFTWFVAGRTVARLTVRVPKNAR